MPEGTKASSDDQSAETQSSLKKSLLAQVVAKELGGTASSSITENKKPMLPSFSWDFGKKKIPEAAVNGKEVTTTSTSTTVSKVETPGGFIFGSRLSEKVTNADTSTADDKPKDASSIFKQFSSNGDSFFKVNSSDSKFLKPFGDGSEIKTFTSISISEPEQIETITGEEGEKNLLHISCKFYMFEKDTKTWLERGSGTFRINEIIGGTHDYRIVGRATGNQRVCINSKIFPEMLLEKMTDKRLKLSALCPELEAPQLFVINGSPASIASVQQQLESLIRKVKSQVTRKRPLDIDIEADKDSNIPTKVSQIDKDESKSSNEETSDKEDSEDNENDSRNNDSTQE